jgi:hypothetical protein
MVGKNLLNIHLGQIYPAGIGGKVQAKDVFGILREYFLTHKKMKPARVALGSEAWQVLLLQI